MIPARPVVAVDAGGLFDLAREAPWFPYQFLPEVTEDAAARYLTADWARIAARPGAAGYVTGAGVPEGVLYYEPLPWDSEVLGFRCARVASVVVDPGAPADAKRGAAIARSLFQAALARARADGVVHVSVRIDARASEVVQAAEAAGFVMVDGLLRFAVDLEAEAPREAPPPPARVREARPGDIPALRVLAQTGFTWDRFHADPAIPRDAANRLHGEWVENAARGRTGAGLLVAEAPDGVAGFFILGEDALAKEVLGVGVGQLVLIAVGSAWRGRGIGALLTRASLDWHRARGNAVALVGTQLANVAATNLYMGAGFRLVDTSVSLRWWDETAS